MTRKILIPMDVHNAFRECREEDKTESRNTNPKVHPFLIPLLTGLSKKRPTWTFITEDRFGESVGDAYQFSRFTIMEDGEALGKVWRHSSWRRNRDVTFAFDCTRLRNTRQRGDHTETKDVKKAIKTILENMYPTTPGEFMSAARSTAASKLSSKLYSYHQNYNITKSTLNPVLENFVLDNPDAVKAHSPQVADKIDTLLAQRAEATMAKDLQTLIGNNKTTLLVERGNKVFIERADADKVFASCSLNEVSDNYKRVMGVLKLAPDNTLVPDLGYRVSEDTFVAFDKQADT